MGRERKRKEEKNINHEKNRDKERPVSESAKERDGSEREGVREDEIQRG